MTHTEGEFSKVLLTERLGVGAMLTLLLLTPGMFVRWLSGFWGLRVKRQGVEIHVIAKTALALWILFGGYWRHPVVIWLIAYLLVDLFSNLLAIVFLREFWRTRRSLNRKLILLIFNYVEFSAWFACLYLANGGLLDMQAHATVNSPLIAFYFSVVTASTEGASDIVPAGDNGHLIALLHVALAVIFLLVVVSYFVGVLTSRDEDPVASYHRSSAGETSQPD